MQDVEKNMDDLFRKAVDNYTLQPGDSNWDTIVAQLTDDNTATPANIHHKSNSPASSILLLVLLLIPLSTAMFSYNTIGSAAGRHIAVAETSSLQTKEKINVAAAADIKPDTAKQALYTTEFSRHLKPSFPNAEIHNSLPERKTADTIIAAPKEGNNTVGFIVNQVNDSAYSSTAPFSSPEAQKTIVANQSNITDNDKQPITPALSSSKKHRIYVGAMAGLAFNEVKHQGFNKPGFELGIIAGYRIYKNAAVETGLKFSKKYYFSDGKYFSMDKMSGSMPSEMKIMSLEGSSSLYQIPMSFKYDAVHKKTSAFFSSAGISSYILVKEQNNYKTSMNGVQQSMQGMYKHVSVDFASAIDVSIGYEHVIQQRATIRIQPYLQIPLKGMGMGSMRVMSTGIQIAYTR